VRYSTLVTFEQALRDGEHDGASAILEQLVELPETGGLYMPACYADLALSFDHRGRHDDAITAMECAIEHGWNGRPDGRSDIAEFHLRAGRAEQAAEIWAQLKAKDPDDVWLYKAAGLSYSKVGSHELAVAWLEEGIELAMRAVAPIHVDDYIAWCEQNGEDPEDAPAQYAAYRLADDQAIRWPPGRNEPCWCGSQRKDKRCCGPAPAGPVHDTDR